MRTRDRAALNLTPLLLRLSLATVFIWAGLGKFMASIEVSGSEAAILANYGVLPNPHTNPHTNPSAPTLPAPAATPSDEMQPKTTTTPDNQTSTISPPAHSTTIFAAWHPAQPESTAEDSSPSVGLPDDLTDQQDQATPTDTTGESRSPAQPPRVLASASDFPEPVRVRRYASIVLILHHAINPGLDPDNSEPLMPLWPDFDKHLDFDPWPVYLAWTASLTELIAGSLLLIGLLTRLSALGLTGVMLTAMWLTTVGPAIQSGHAALGFLPQHDPFDITAWTPVFLQFTLLMSALSLLFAGPGMLSLDRLLLGARRPAQTPANTKPEKK